MRVAPHIAARDFLRELYTPLDPNSFKKKPLHPSLIKVINSVVRDLKLNDEDLSRLKIHLQGRFIPTNFGRIDKEYGALIGLPSHFNFGYGFEDPQPDLHNHYFYDREKPLPSIIEGEWGLCFKENLTLSDDAKKFRIALEILRSQRTNIYFLFNYPWIHSLITYCLCFLINRSSPVGSNRSLRFANYLIMGVLSAYLFVCVNDTHNKMFETGLLYSTCDLGEDYRKGGVEFFDKFIKRNKALLQMCPEKEKENINLNGDYKINIFRNKLNLIKSRDICYDFTAH